MRAPEGFCCAEAGLASVESNAEGFCCAEAGAGERGAEGVWVAEGVGAGDCVLMGCDGAGAGDGVRVELTAYDGCCNAVGVDGETDDAGNGVCE